MKNILCCAGALFFLNLPLYQAQQNSGPKINYKAGKVLASKAVQDLLSQNKLQNVYSQEALKKYRIQGVECTNEPVKQCLEKILKGLPFEVLINNNVVIIRDAAKSEAFNTGTVKKDTIPSSDNTSLIEEVVLTGYQTQKKENLTGSISSVKPSELQTLPSPDITRSLDGRMPGVQVLTDNSPGGGATIRVRGFSTINNNDPLVMIDGVPVTDGLSSLDSADIESIQVLKDAATASVFGSRAANGVVLVTTKQGGKANKLKVGLNSFYGVQNAYNLPRPLNAHDYADLLWRSFKNDGITPNSDIYGSNPANPTIPDFLDNEKKIPSSDTNWEKVIFHPATVQNHHLSLSNGGERGSQYFGLGYVNQEGILKHTGYERFQAMLNSKYKITDFLTIGENLNASLNKTLEIQTNRALHNIIFNALQFPSIVPVYDNEGDFAGNPINDIQNPLGKLYRNKENTRKNIRLTGNVYGELAISKFKFIDLGML